MSSLTGLAGTCALPVIKVNEHTPSGRQKGESGLGVLILGIHPSQKDWETLKIFLGYVAGCRA
jgi:hypothetical protein